MVKHDCTEINEAAFRDAGKTPAVVVFSWARASFDKEYERRKRLADYLRSLGACIVDFADYSNTINEIAKKVTRSNLIYLPGGLASVLIERLKARYVDELLRKYEGIIVGRSAGALALGKKCVVTKNRRNPTSTMVNGIELVDFCLTAHYKPSKDKTLKNLSSGEKIYAIPELSALVDDNGLLSSTGEVYLFQNGEKTRVD